MKQLKKAKFCTNTGLLHIVDIAPKAKKKLTTYTYTIGIDKYERLHNINNIIATQTDEPNTNVQVRAEPLVFDKDIIDLFNDLGY